MLNVWTYWEGPQPTFLTLCLDTISYWCGQDCNYVHVTPYNVHEYIPKGILHDNWNHLDDMYLRRDCPALRSDCIRVALLAQYGGLYIDADTLMMKSPTSVIDESKECCYLMWSYAPLRVLNGYIYCKLNSTVAAQWLDKLNERLSTKQVGWGAFGEQILTPIVLSKEEDCLKLPLSTFLPLEVDYLVLEFFSMNTDWRSYLTEHTIAFGLNYSWMVGRCPQYMLMPYSHMESSTMMIHQLITDFTRDLHARKNADTSQAIS